MKSLSEFSAKQAELVNKLKSDVGLNEHQIGVAYQIIQRWCNDNFAQVMVSESRDIKEIEASNVTDEFIIRDSLVSLTNKIGKQVMISAAYGDNADYPEWHQIEEKAGTQVNAVIFTGSRKPKSLEDISGDIISDVRKGQ